MDIGSTMKNATVYSLLTCKNYGYGHLERKGIYCVWIWKCILDSYNWIPMVLPNAMTIHPLDYISYIPGSDVVMLAEW